MSARPQRDLLPDQQYPHAPITKGNNYVSQDLPVALVHLMKMPMKGATTSVAYATEGAQGDTWVVGFQ